MPIVGNSEVEPALRTLAGRGFLFTNAQIIFGEGNQFGDITIRDIVGRDKLEITLNLLTPEQAYDVRGLPNPYLGLRAFAYEDRARYAGRERLVAATNPFRYWYHRSLRRGESHQPWPLDMWWAGYCAGTK